MNKIKLLALTLLVAMGLMGAGYAYWTDTLTINNTVTTGELDLDFECLTTSDYDNYLINGEGEAFSRSNEYVTSSVGQETKELVFSNENFYPGAGAWLKFKIVNKGTIPAKIENIVGDVIKGEELKDIFRYTIANLSIYRTHLDGNSKIIEEETIYANNTTTTTFSDFVYQLNNLLKNYEDGSPIILEPGDYLVVNGVGDKFETGFDIYMPTTVEEFINNGTTATEKQEYSFKLELNYTQHNAQ